MKVVLPLLLLAAPCFAFSQFSVDEDLLKKIAAEKDEASKIDFIIAIYTPTFESSTSVLIETGQKLLAISKQNKSVVEEASAYSILGQAYRLSGNHVKALEYHYKALPISEKIASQSLLAMIKNQLAHVYKDREEHEKAITIYKQALEHALKGTNPDIRVWPLSNLGATFYNAGQFDSALVYLQRAYERNITTGYKLTLHHSLVFLGGVHSNLNHPQLALSYYNMAANESMLIQNPRSLNLTYAGLAEHFLRNGKTDSAIFYAQRAINSVSNTSFFYLSSRPAQLLYGIYEKMNCDSSVKYINLHKSANDALYNSRANQQVQLMTMEEDLRQKELAEEKLQTEEERKQSIQYGMITLGIVVLAILFLLLSNSIIVTEKFVSFFSILGLLIVFEFINLLIHPFLGNITHHSPILMLLAMVALAALLIPLHHHLENWIKTKMTSKNKKIRLEAARKTMKELGEVNTAPEQREKN